MTVKMGENYDFSGYATRNDLLCDDGRVINKDAFARNDGKVVPLIWNHDHKNPEAVIGHALLENREDGVYAYGVFNDEPEGQKAKRLMQNGDVRSLSIWADKLKHNAQRHVVSGDIRELSLVLGGANPGAYIDCVMAHSIDGIETDEIEEANICWDENILIHACGPIKKKKELKHGTDPDDDLDDDDPKEPEDKNDPEDKDDPEEKEDPKDPEDKDDKKDPEDKLEHAAGASKTIGEVLGNDFTEEQRSVVYAIIDSLFEEKKEENGGSTMAHNIFENTTKENVLSHSMQEEIIGLAKQKSVGSLKEAIALYQAEHSDTLAHSVFEDESIGTLFPEYELVKKGAPDTLERDQSWITKVMSKINKSPISRVRTRNADARISELRAKGYQKKGDKKTETGAVKLLTRTTDPQTVYVKDSMHRDDIIDITDFDVVGYQWMLLRHLLNEEIALAALVGDRREDSDPDKIHEEHIRPIWLDADLYTIHKDLDLDAAKTELQGTGTGASFGENYIMAEAMITAALYAREEYKGSGNIDMLCTPHIVNIMLLARDMNGRRIFDSVDDLAKALNVKSIVTVEQFEGLERTDAEGHKHELLALFVDLADYTFGASKGGEITQFEDFDMDFNQYKYMLETRLSGALTKPYSAIAIEKPVASE